MALVSRIICAIAFASLASPAMAQDVIGPDAVDSETAGVIHGALEYLAAQQGLDGSWTQAAGSEAYPVAMTGCALMAFMGSGNLPDEGEFAHNVTAGMQYLLDQIESNGLFRSVDQGRYMYSHGIATIALCELYGQTRSPLLRQRLSLIVNAVISAQSPQGGWRYEPQSRDADISVTVLQIAALRAAKNAGIEVPQVVIDRAIAFIGQCYNDSAGAFSYQPHGDVGFARTAAAIYSLQLCGLYDDPRVAKGSDYLFANDDENDQWWPYGCSYAAPAQYMIGGDTWRRWYGEMKAKLLSSVITDGNTSHWDDRAARELGPIYDTSVFATILAIPWHYIPLYQR
ncbi:MAG: prenyltransferase/squalene oxidase repeat-containing protein [Chthoniobacteraceae bacterium]|jgi:prenyltransferase beta subunit